MIGKKFDFYVKKMQKFGTVLFGVLWMVMALSGCTRKDEAQMMLLSLETETEAESVAEATESEEKKAALPKTVEESGQIELQESPQSVTSEEVQPSFLYVHICGAVQNPGVYELPAGSRVYEVVELAGGFTENAAKDYVNQAQVLPDASKIVIPTIQEVEAIKENNQSDVQYGILEQEAAESNVQTPEAAERVDSGLLNLNTATRSELCELPGIGETKADAIIAYRSRIGVFTSKEQIMEIEGIKDGLYSKIKDKICVE